jgi:hypothetical protein
LARHLALAKSYGVATIPDVWGSGIAVAAALHAVASIRPFPHTANPLPLLNEPIIEFDRKHDPLRDELLAEPFTLKDGRPIVGAVILIVLYGMITAFAVSPYFQGIIQGAILVGAVYYATRND